MNWGFYQMNHQISIREGNGSEFDDATDSSCWNWAYTDKQNGIFINEQNDCMVLASSPWISAVPHYKIEAESLNNSLIAYNGIVPEISRERECSGWNYIGNLGCGNRIIFDNIYVEKEGVFTVRIYYLSGDSRNMKMKTSCNPNVIITLNFPAMPDWYTVGVVTISQVKFAKGINRIEFLTDNLNPEWAPDIDKIEIIRA